MTDKLKWDSNNGQVADREFAIARVRNGALELCTDEKIGRFVGVHLDKDGETTPAATDPFPFASPSEITIVVNGPITEVSGKLIPDGYSARMYDCVVNGVTYLFSEATKEPVEIVSGIFRVNIEFWGTVRPLYDVLDSASLPANGQTVTPLTITSYRVCDLLGKSISAPKGPVTIDISGETPVADTTPPTVLSVAPVGTAVALDQGIVLNCSEAVVAGSGNFVIWDTVANVALETIASNLASYVGSQIVLPRAAPEAHSNGYELRWDSGAFEDAAGNPVAAETGGTWGWITEAASSGGGGGSTGVNETGTPSPDPDVTVTSLSALYATLTAWQSDWSGTVPSGRTAAHGRVIGLNATTGGLMALNGFNFPQRVVIRHVGAFTVDSIALVSCSNYHAGTVDLSNSNNIVLYLMDVRAPDGGAYSNGYITMTNCTNCGLIRTAARGWPFNPSIPDAEGTTACAVRVVGGSNLIFRHNVGYYFQDGFAKFSTSAANVLWNGCGGRWYGGDDITFQVGTYTDFTSIANLWSRTRVLAGSPSAPLHGDALQANKGAGFVRFTSRYDVFYRGHWGGVADILVNPGEGGWAAYFLGGGGVASTGPHLQEHNILVNGNSRGITGFPGGNCTARFNTLIQHDDDQAPASAYPLISFGSVDTSERNFTVTNSSYSATNKQNTGVGGINVILGGGVNLTGSPNFSLLLPYISGIPSNYTDLTVLEPVIGSKLHPGYTPSNQRVGAFEYWEKLWAGDPEVVLSKVGWPIAPIFIADFDFGDAYWGGYTGTFDANGDNV